MVPGEYAILYSGFQPPRSDQPHSIAIDGPYCAIFPTLADAEAHATQQAELYPALLCRIYDHHGLGRQSISEIRGNRYKGESEISAQFRRWCGSFLLFGGLALTILDWRSDFGLLWPATVGTRMIPFGLVLLVTELVIVIEARRKGRRTGPQVP